MSKITRNDGWSPAELSVLMEELWADEYLRYLETGVYILYQMEDDSRFSRRE